MHSQLRNTAVVAAVFLITALAMSACGGSDGGSGSDAGRLDAGSRDAGGSATDGAVPDAASDDAGSPVADGAAPDAADQDAGGGGTPCGSHACDPATEFCFECNCGGPTTTECRPIVAGCETDRTCACLAATHCVAGLAMCSDSEEPNRIFCETGRD